MRQVEEIFIPSDAFDELDPRQLDRDELTTSLQEEALACYEQREQELGEELMRHVERFLLLEIIDQRWQEHLYDMDYLREGIHLRGFAQIEPLVAYKNEAFELFRELMHSVWGDFARLIFNVQVTLTDEHGAPMAPPQQRRPSPASSSSTGGGRVSYSGGSAAAPSVYGAAAAAAGAAGMQEVGGAGANGADQFQEPAVVQQRRVDSAEQQLGRNDPCWCGSGKKFKKCHGA
jgi:preprotein translocase subunit SecA